MKLADLLKELRKSEKLSSNATTFIITEGQTLTVDKVRTKGDMVLIYTEPAKPLTA